MSKFKQLYKPLLDSAQWLAPEDTVIEGTEFGHWLLELDSLSRRFERHCRAFTVSLEEQGQIHRERLTDDERALIGDVDCLLRKVVLKGDGVPWVFARTLIPLTTLTGQEQDLAQLGEMPLGFRVFTDRSARRDALEVANVGTENKPVWARRSRLWLNNKPLLVAELFLQEAPIYKETLSWK
ncbi:chorismate lyase [Photobacterium sp. DNB23_23_1]|uniref:Probable chorismate pyruvate-lyase n=1 Tax=Photobacterium pectinilyticum TaxID=2906793 RepID=A0ABT1MW47_9GAMM|nr:chorismate lyase [Photobacterium sp. ZSDE20]MCQ1056695.1 chorismate lyase [Photobacterium sp. ZSDE20]MDD1820918.1 chorismate lyase [Photobacterium sp. ZSDE20]